MLCIYININVFISITRPICIYICVTNLTSWLPETIEIFTYLLTYLLVWLAGEAGMEGGSDRGRTTRLPEVCDAHQERKGG